MQAISEFSKKIRKSLAHLRLRQCHYLLSFLRALRVFVVKIFFLMVMIFLLGHSAIFAQAVAQFQGARITRVNINFEGAAEATDQGEFLDVIDIRPGEEYSAVKIRDAILKLYKSGRASYVQVQATLVAGGVELLFIVRRQLRVSDVTFSGTPIFADADLRPRLVGLDPGAKLTQPNVDRSAENLVRFYHDAGYFQVAITPTTKPDANGVRATVDFAIAPGIQAQIGSFDLIGDFKLDRKLVLAELKTQPGAPFTQTQLQADIEQLRKLHIEAGYLDPRIGTPEVAYNSENNTVTIRLEISSGPKVAVTVEGFNISPDKLRKTLPLYEQGGIDEFTVEEGRRRLLELVQRQGYFFADINAQIERPETDSVSIAYRIDPGQRYRVTDVRIIGTKKFDYDEIAEELKTHKASFLSRGITSQEYLMRDSEIIAAKLRDLGYAKAAVPERRLGVSPNNENLIITFVVEEGPLVMVDGVVFEGNRVFSEGELRARLPKRKVPYFSRSRLNEETDKLLALYSRQGYAEASIVYEVANLAEDRVRVTFRIEEGDQVIINRIIISNRGRSGEGTIRKFLAFREGDLLKREDLSKSEQQLYATGAFRTAVIRSEFISRNGDGHALHDIFVETVESQPYTLIYGFGFQSQDGPRGLFQITDANFLGRLQAPTLTLRGSRLEQLGQISYQFPRPFGLPVNPLALFFYQRRQDVSFNSRRFTALLQIERRLSETSDLIFRYTYEDVNVFNRNITGTPLDREDQPIRLGRVSGTFIRDTRDNIFDATKGTFTTSDLSFATVGLGSQREFVRFFANHQRYLRLVRKPRLIFASNLQLGLAGTFDDRPRLPISERFFAGGANTLRGFGFERAGPRNPNTSQPVGGNALFVLNSELRFPLFSRFGGVFFHDTGNVFRTVSDFELGKFSNTVGPGLRIATPVGPVRFDVGFLINPRVPERRVQFHISFGQAF